MQVSNESIERLKLSLMKENANKEITKKKGFTTYETLAAHIWRPRARALKLNYDGETMLIIIVGIKPHLLDPLPSGYYGNTIVESYVVSTVRELNERPLMEIVKLIRERINDGFSSDYIRHTIDSMETKPMKFNYESGTTMNLANWRHLGYLKNVDFGWKLVNTMPVPCDINGSMGLCIILPPSKLDPSMHEGVRVYASLPSVAMPKFKEEMKALESTQNA